MFEIGIVSESHIGLNINYANNDSDKLKRMRTFFV